MHLHLHLPLFTLIIATTTLTTAVDITFRFPPDRWNPSVTRGPQTCTSILPGHCCVPIPTYPAYDNIPSSGDAFGYRVELNNLTPLHLGLAWAVNYTDTWRSTVGFPGFRVDLPGCTTRPWETRIGPGSFSIGDAPGDRWAVRGKHYLVGAEYLVLPQGGMPESEGGQANWLGMQGVERLVVGGGRWVPGGRKPYWSWSSPARRRRWLGRRDDDGDGGGEGDGDGGKGHGYGHGRKMVRGQQEGTVEWRSPKYLKYPDVLEAGGVRYSDRWRGDLVYKDAGGRQLNLTSWSPVFW